MYLGNDKYPIVPGLIRFFQHFLASTVNQFNERVFAGESTFGLSVFADLPMEALNNIGCINDASKLFRVFEILRESIPVIIPRL